VDERIHSANRSFKHLLTEIMRDSSEGSTKVLNRYHSTENSDVLIQKMREAQIQLDDALAECYGFKDVDLQHDFYSQLDLPESDNVRFTISSQASSIIIQRLSELNKERYNEEVANGLHQDGKSRSKNAKKTHRRVNLDQPKFNF
jgi:hypothetical protein